MSNVLDYDHLVKLYYENLHTTLRNFRPGPDYLESWVHDENHNRSIVGIFEAAKENGIDELALKIGPQLSDALDRAWLTENLEMFGEVSFQEEGTDLRLGLNFKKLKSEFPIHCAYQKNLEAASRSLRWEGTASTTNGSAQTFTASSQGVTLSLVVDNETRIQEARHSGAKGALLALLDHFCCLIRNIPFQEAAEHGTIYLERSLRDPGAPAPVPGLVTPENADPAFQLPAILIRQAYASYLKTNGRERYWNHFEPPLTAGWERLSAEEQVSRIRDTWRALCDEKKLPYGDMEVIAVKGGSRVVLSGHAHSQKKTFGHDLMVLERELKRRLEPRLEVTLESIEDRNKREQRTKRDLLPAR